MFSRFWTSKRLWSQFKNGFKRLRALTERTFYKNMLDWFFTPVAERKYYKLAMHHNLQFDWIIFQNYQTSYLESFQHERSIKNNSVCRLEKMPISLFHFRHWFLFMSSNGILFRNGFLKFSWDELMGSLASLLCTEPDLRDTIEHEA